MISEIIDRKLTTVSVDCTYIWKEECVCMCMCVCVLTKPKQQKEVVTLKFPFLNYIQRKWWKTIFNWVQKKESCCNCGVRHWRSRHAHFTLVLDRPREPRSAGQRHSSTRHHWLWVGMLASELQKYRKKCEYGTKTSLHFPLSVHWIDSIFTLL